VLLAGHSSSIPIVRNQNYKAFNNIEDLKRGSVISVYSGEHEYRYSVTGVRLADASQSDEAIVELPTNGKFLKLITCDNSFATKTHRFVVTAEFVEAHPLSS
jgi:LPXTG-site transpeptidase (sortase) family protein